VVLPLAGTGASAEPLSDGSLRVKFDKKYWRIWPDKGCWVEIDIDIRVIGEMHYGDLAGFCQKHIKRNKFLPKNHLKKWSRREINKLQKMNCENRSVPDISVELGRSNSSVLAKSASILGVNFDHLVNESHGFYGTINELLDELTLHKDSVREKTN